MKRSNSLAVFKNDVDIMEILKGTSNDMIPPK
ncbi:hypothetical protein CLIT_10c02550 [Peptoclostridium litorale DSM 5388]|uniref:Uncharacterized protein n=1 Tax=Peptoclostridium litorale DSM 5388 TaxID=1121324 RepID=A0A069RFG4_PEPLI|nr:hypothetical protein CLIT_10c02550 [Peptoclostridium litorale DSM 5388]